MAVKRAGQVNIPFKLITSRILPVFPRWCWWCDGWDDSCLSAWMGRRGRGGGCWCWWRGNSRHALLDVDVSVVGKGASVLLCGTGLDFALSFFR